ncbi:MAG: hypothetical protein K2H04_07760 [Bacteroidaceae bacterium]|nr:hypothetical protein [Bacteroidaceae bacterium]MDE5999944.1 hypothetical protein [Bacteroidaceae bacterium]
MKKVIFTLLTLIASANSIQAQNKNLYDVVYEEATKIVNNPKSSDDQIQINQFKVTALNYMSMMIQKSGMKKDEMFYATQAVMMSSFVTDFHANMLKAQEMSPSKRNEILKIYTDACKYNPMFKDTDKERANAYVNDKSSLTPFCLDTNWEKAYDQATTLAKAALK